MKIINLLTIMMVLMTIACNKENIEPKDEKKDKVKLSVVDKNATDETKALFSNLWAIQEKGTMFGHHEGLLYGRTWNNESGRSDVKDICGDYPAVSTFDFAKLEIGSSASINGSAFSDVKRVTKEAYARGEVVMYCWHGDNPLTGGNAWDNSNRTVVREILTTGSATNTKFKIWLDRIAEYTLSLKDDNNKLIPIIFRPFHEHTQTWSWWGTQCTTENEFINLWHFTVEYLRDTKGVHNMLFAISPQMDAELPASTLLFRYPGDDYVDFLGMDCYHGVNADVFAHNLSNLAAFSKEKMKPCGVTETGIEGVLNNGVEYADFWTKEILMPLVPREVSMVVMWRNKYSMQGNDKHFFGPSKGHASENDFKRLYNSNSILFSGELPDMYSIAEGFEVE